MPSRRVQIRPAARARLDAVQAIEAMRAGEIKVWIALGGNLVAAISDTAAAEAALQATEMTVQISTKLNRIHPVGEEALILPTMGRTEIDVQATGPQLLSVEDSVCAVHPSARAGPADAAPAALEISIITRLARAVLGDKVAMNGPVFESNYDLIRDHIPTS